MVTANHYWADGIVAGVLLAAVLGVQAAIRRAAAARAVRLAMADGPAGEPQEAVTGAG